MKTEPILAAAAVVTFGFATGAAAAPVTYDIVWSNDSGWSGSGFFAIDSADIAPDVTLGLGAVAAFGATFTEPGFGSLTFDLDDLNSATIKFDGAGVIDGASFGTENNGIDPFLNDDDPVTSLKIGALGDQPEVLAVFGHTITLRTDAVPEPGTLALLAAGAAGLPLLRRRRRKSA